MPVATIPLIVGALVLPHAWATAAVVAACALQLAWFALLPRERVGRPEDDPPQTMPAEALTSPPQQITALAPGDDALIDSLTGLASREGALLDAACQLRTSDEVHMVVCNIDDFASLNAELGSSDADEVLRAVASALRTVLADWSIGRLGGDEFVATSAHPLTEWQAGAITALEVSTDAGTRIAQLSAGSSSSSLSGNTPDSLLRDAQAAMRLAKSRGKQRVVVADAALRDRTDRQRRTTVEVQRALEHDDIVAWGQPIVHLATGQPAGIELLARWPRHGSRLEYPDVFIPIIESLGLSSVLGEYMIREAVGVLRRLTALGDDRAFVTVNVSASHLIDPVLPSLIAVQLAAHSLDPARLIVELTESQQLPDSSRGRAAVDRLRALGVGVASDDLGAGWSSLSQMLRSRFTHVKTDRALIAATERHGGTKLIEAIRELALGAGQIAIAEGIETGAELAAARQAGFDLGQGWLLGRPAPLEATLLWFDDPLPVTDSLRGRA